ncbi:MAG: rRNA maturation RNase YbeY [Cyanobacteria bacterium P01_A01_bin.135]
MPNCLEVGLQVNPSLEPLLSQQAPDLASQLVWEGWVTSWLTALAPRSPQPPPGGYELGLLLTDDQGIQGFNRDYRGQDKPTDVLAFAPADDSDDSFEVDWGPDYPVYLGDIVISIETGERVQQAALPRPDGTPHSLREEIAWLAAHGLLHLLGWDHPDDQQLDQMLQQQARLLATIGLTAPYTEAGQLTPLPENY